MRKWHRCYVLCSFGESHYTSDMNPRNVYGVYFSKAVLEHCHPELKICWNVEKTSELVIGVSTNDPSEQQYFVLVRAFNTDDEISPVPEEGSIEDAWKDRAPCK